MGLKDRHLSSFPGLSPCRRLHRLHRLLLRLFGATPICAVCVTCGFKGGGRSLSARGGARGGDGIAWNTKKKPPYARARKSTQHSLHLKNHLRYTSCTYVHCQGVINGNGNVCCEKYLQPSPAEKSGPFMKKSGPFMKKSGPFMKKSGPLFSKWSLHFFKWRPGFVKRCRLSTECFRMLNKFLLYRKKHFYNCLKISLGVGSVA